MVATNINHGGGHRELRDPGGSKFGTSRASVCWWGAKALSIARTCVCRFLRVAGLCEKKAYILRSLAFQIRFSLQRTATSARSITAADLNNVARRLNEVQRVDTSDVCPYCAVLCCDGRCYCMFRSTTLRCSTSHFCQPLWCDRCCINILHGECLFAMGLMVPGVEVWRAQGLG